MPPNSLDLIVLHLFLKRNTQGCEPRGRASCSQGIQLCKQHQMAYKEAGAGKGHIRAISPAKAKKISREQAKSGLKNSNGPGRQITDPKKQNSLEIER